MKITIFGIKFHCSRLVPGSLINYMPLLVLVVALHKIQVPCLSPLHLSSVLFDPKYILLLQTYVMMALWCHAPYSSSTSTLAQAMACCLKAPSHYLNQCWLLINKDLWYSPWAVSHQVPRLLFCIMSLKIILLKLLPQLPGADELKANKEGVVGYNIPKQRW